MANNINSGWTYIKNNKGYVDLLDNSGEITYSPVNGICGGVPSSCETTANFSYNIGLVDWTMSGDDPCNIVKSVGGIPSCNQEMLVCWFNYGDSNKSYSGILTDYGAKIFVRKNVDECNHVMIISGDPSTQDYSNYQFVHGNVTQYFSTSGYTDSGYPVIATDPDNGDFSPKYRSGTTYAGHKFKYLPNTNTISGECIVNNPNLVELYFPSYSETDAAYSGCTIKHIGNRAFHHNVNLSAITLNAVETIGDYAFSGCGIVNIDWGHCNCKSSKVKTKTIGRSAFQGNNMTELVIPSGVTSIGPGAFANCRDLISVSIPSSVTNLGDSTSGTRGNVFFNCSSLSSITIPSEVKTINRRTFADCTSLQSVTIVGKITNIGASAFNNCHRLSSMTFCSDNITLSSSTTSGDAFAGVPNDNGCTIHCKHSATNSFKEWRHGISALKYWTVSGDVITQAHPT